VPVWFAVPHPYRREAQISSWPVEGPVNKDFWIVSAKYGICNVIKKNISSSGKI
jgi:hypothetical protein